MRSGFLGGGVGPTAIKRRSGLAAPVPVAGAELIVNGDFSAWTGDNPVDWQIIGESGSDPAVSEAVGGARLFSTSVYIVVRQSTAVIGNWYAGAMSIASIAAGSIRLGIGTDYVICGSPGSHIFNTRSLGTDFFFARFSGLTDAIISQFSAVPLTLASLFSTRAYASADCDLSVAVTRTAGTQAGLCARLDSASSPANFIIAYLDGAGNVKVDKCVGGTYTAVISGAVTYAAGRVLRLVCSGNDVSAYYNGTQVGTTQTVSDAGIASNTRHGLFSTYAANAFTGYTAA